MRTNKNTYTPDSYISALNKSNEASYATPTRIIVSHIHKAYEAQDKKQADFLIGLAFEMQIFWMDYNYKNNNFKNAHLNYDSEAYSVIKAFYELFNDLNYVEKLLPFLNTRYKEVTIEVIFYIIWFALREKKEVPEHLYQQALQLARDVLIEKPIYHKLNAEYLHEHIRSKISMIERLADFERKDTLPILNHIVSNEQEMELIIKVAKGIISGKRYLGNDLPL